MGTTTWASGQIRSHLGQAQDLLEHSPALLAAELVQGHLGITSLISALATGALLGTSHLVVLFIPVTDRAGRRCSGGHT
jgi:hypothetical protein